MGFMPPHLYLFGEQVSILGFRYFQRSHIFPSKKFSELVGGDSVHNYHMIPFSSRDLWGSVYP